MTDHRDDAFKRTPIHRHGDDAVLDAVQAARVAELESGFRRPEPDLGGILPWSEVSPGVPVAARQAELDELNARNRVVDQRFEKFVRDLDLDDDDDDDDD